MWVHAESPQEEEYETPRINGFKKNAMVKLEKMIYSVQEQSLKQDSSFKVRDKPIGWRSCWTSWKVNHRLVMKIESQAIAMKNLGQMRTVLEKRLKRHKMQFNQST
jgi:hypothetical protein